MRRKLRSSQPIPARGAQLTVRSSPSPCPAEPIVDAARTSRTLGCRALQMQARPCGKECTGASTNVVGQVAPPRQLAEAFRWRRKTASDEHPTCDKKSRSSFFEGGPAARRGSTFVLRCLAIHVCLEWGLPQLHDRAFTVRGRHMPWAYNVAPHHVVDRRAIRRLVSGVRWSAESAGAQALARVCRIAVCGRGACVP